jgi:hypothetical protein
MNLRFALLSFVAVFGTCARAETVSFLMNGAVVYNGRPESYVVTTSDPVKIEQARAYLKQPSHPPYLYARVRIAAGADGVNRNYAAPTQPLWNWHVTELIDWVIYDPRQPEFAVYIITRDGMPSMVPDIMAGAGAVVAIDPTTGATATPQPVDTIGLRYFPVAMELKGSASGRVANVSQRGFVGAGERVLIAGFIVEGGPRIMVLRALGPSLRAFGVTDVLANPKIELYRGTEKITENDDWQSSSIPSGGGSKVPSAAANFTPGDPKESALEVSLVPGGYTLIVRGADGGTGVALAEVFDLTTAN